MLNIYDRPLEPCGEQDMTRGSWDGEKKCSEIDGGLHQICVKSISVTAPRFSKLTGQSDWSDKRQGQNHCVCLGAFALYQSKQNDKNERKRKPMLKCDAIPKIAMSSNYVQRFLPGWSTWNGLEKENQIVDGVVAMVSECATCDMDKRNCKDKRKALQSNFCSFANEYPEWFENTEPFIKWCGST